MVAYTPTSSTRLSLCMPHTSTTTKLARWFIFGVVFALVPLLITSVIKTTIGPPVLWCDIVAHGELVLLAVALCGAGLGEILGTRTKEPLSDLCAGGACTTVLVGASIYYSAVASASERAEQINRPVVLKVSLALYCAALASSAVCVVLAGHNALSEDSNA